MNLKLPFIVLFIIAFHFIQAQQFSDSIWSPTKDELLLKKWPTDSMAEAAVIFDKGIIGTHYDVENRRTVISFNRFTKIKVFETSGFEYATIEIPLYQSKDVNGKLLIVRAKVYNWENNQITTSVFDTSMIYTEIIDANHVVKKFTLPNVKKGSVIEYEYLYTSPFLATLPEWRFQWEIPVRSSICMTVISRNFTYASIIRGSDNVEIQTNDTTSYLKWKLRAIDPNESFVLNPIRIDNLEYTYSLHNIPAFKDEDFITSKDDNYIKIKFQLTKYGYGSAEDFLATWDDFAKRLFEAPEFGKYLKSASDFGEDLNFSSTTDTITTIREIVDYIKHNYSWNQSYSFDASKKIKELNQQKTGTSADLNLLLIGILQSKGINASPVLISTRSHGKVEADYPLLTSFNSVIAIVRLKNKTLLLDATNRYCAFNNLPPDCLNDEGYMLVNKTQHEWISITNNESSMVSQNIQMQIDPDNNLISANINTQASYMEAASLREQLSEDEKKAKKALFPNLDIDSCQVINLNESNSRLRINTWTTSDLIHSNNLIIINPFLTLTPQTNLFKSETRSNPIDLTYSYSKQYNSIITIPDGYAVETLPSSISINDTLMSINSTFNYNKASNTIICSAYYTFKKTVYPADDYSSLKHLFTNVLLFNNPLVLKARSND